MGRRPPSRERSPSADPSQAGRRRRRRRQQSGERRPVRSRSGSGSPAPAPRRRGRRSPPPPSRSPPRLRSRSRSRSAPRRRSRRRGRGRGRSFSQGRWQPSRSPERNGRSHWRPHRGAKPEGCRTIWVGWLDSKPEEEEVIAFFKDCGVVTDVKSSERHVRGFFIHVTFDDTENVDAAMKKEGEEFMGTRIQLDFAYMDKVMTNPRAEAEPPSSRRYRPKSVKPPNGHTLWIGDVSIDATEQDMIDLFESCGKIEMICLQVNQLRNGQFGHVKFLETEDVDKAVEKAGTAVKGVPIRLDYAEDKPVAAYRVGKDRSTPEEKQKPEDCRTVWIGGLPSECTEDMILEFFGRCGEIREVRLDRSKRSGTLFCHVEFGDTEAVDRAVRLSGERLDGSRIRVDFAENRLRGDSGKGRYVPPPGEMPPGHHMPPPMGPPGAWMGPPLGYPPPFFHHPPPPGFPGGPPLPPEGGAPGAITMPPRPSGAPGTEGPEGQPPGAPGRPPPGFPPPGYFPMRPPDMYGAPPPFWGPPPPGYPPPPGFPGHPPPHWGPPPLGPDGYPPPGYPPGYPTPPPRPSAVRPPGPGGPDKPKERSRSACSHYSSYSYSYSVSPARG